MSQANMQKILEISRSLSQERESRILLEQILTSAMELTRCGGGILYLQENGALHACVLRDEELQLYLGGDGQMPDLPPVKIEKGNICGQALLEDRTICVEDVQHCRTAKAPGMTGWPGMPDYPVVSMLVVPFKNRERERIGVLQLLNARDDNGRMTAFSKDMVMAVESVVFQAAITIQNIRYIEEIRALFWSFVRVMSSAVDERTPYNGSHTRHMVECGGRFMDYLNREARRAGKRRPFSRLRRQELTASIWLHDIGKLVIPQEIMDKKTRLSPEQEQELYHRYEMLRLKARIACLEGRATEKEAAEFGARLDQAEQLIRQINVASVVDSQLLERLKALNETEYPDGKGGIYHLLQPEEYEALCIRRGTLSDEEREIMKSHVDFTGKMLSQIHFSRTLSHVPQWAASHHELLDGSGYPQQLCGDQIPYEVRILTILDIFDALVAVDRPYRSGMPVEKALNTLDTMAREGKLDAELVCQFRASRCWEPAE